MEMDMVERLDILEKDMKELDRKMDRILEILEKDVKKINGGKKSRSKTPKGFITQFTEIIVSQPLVLMKNRSKKNKTRKSRS